MQGCSSILCSACLASLLRRWFACGGGGGGEQHYEFPGLPRDRGRLSSSNEPTQLQLLAVHEMESCDIEVCTCIWDLWVKAMQCQSAHVPNDVGRPGARGLSKSACQPFPEGAEIMITLGSQHPPIDSTACFCLRDQLLNALPAACFQTAVARKS